MSVDFTKMVKKADAGIRIIIKNYDCFEWEVFAGADFEEESERIEDALMQEGGTYSYTFKTTSNDGGRKQANSLLWLVSQSDSQNYMHR